MSNCFRQQDRLKSPPEKFASRRLLPSFMQIPLHCHPTTPDLSIQSLTASAKYAANGELHFSFDLSGDLSVMQIPSAGPSIRADHLWQHTCFEAFISVVGETAYHEFNFSPDGRWAVYAFTAYRQPDRATDKCADSANPPAPAITLRTLPNCLQLRAIVRPDLLPSGLCGKTLAIGLSAIVETRADRRTPGIPPLSYWALRHPAERPDFHDRRAWVLRLAPSPAHFVRHENTAP